MRSPQDLAQQLITDYLLPGDLAIDARIKAGDITRFLAARVGDDGHVMAFSADKDEIDHAATSLFLSGLNARVEFIHKTWDTIPTYLNPTEPVGIIMFQLDAESDSAQLATTVQQALLHLKKNGLIIVISDGAEPLAQLVTLAKQLPADSYTTALYQNLQDGETTFVLQRR